jgi:hypothetical protein
MTDATELTIYEYAPAQSPVLAGALVDLERSIEAAAQANLEAVLAEDDSYTETERQAMLVVEELRQVNGLDLAAVLLRAKYLRMIERGNLVTSHPAGYTSLQEMARDQGISLAELSQTLDLANIVFPYVQTQLGIHVAQLWEQIGKSNFRELVPVLKTIITGEDSGAASVRASAERIMDDVAATLTATGRELTEADDPEIRMRAVEQLLQDGANLTNRELRTRIRPERTPSIEATVVGQNGSRVVVMEVDEDQWLLLQRRMGQYIDPMPWNMPQDPHQRQIEAVRIPQLRTLLRLLEGA